MGEIDKMSEKGWFIVWGVVGFVISWLLDDSAFLMGWLAGGGVSFVLGMIASR